MELFKAHESDVVVWVVHNGQTCPGDAGVQSSGVRAERRLSEKAFSTLVPHYIYMKWFPH